MNIAVMSHVKKQELAVQFCTAYCGVLSKHSVFATNATGRMVADATGLPVTLFMSHEHGGIEQIGQRIIYNEIDMVLFFNSPEDNERDQEVLYISRLCDKHSVPMATNVATAELLIHGLARGDLDWRVVMNPNRIPFAL
ncbi:MAG: methylglyoxal synthase [Lawsonibacter sp.]|nr:methylglyoxal synthase [Lawsonibacter sp.]